MAPAAQVISGTISPDDQLCRKFVPFDVPLGTTSIHVKYSYTGREEGNAVDLGLVGVDDKFRGYSGGARSEILVANDEATPGYIPGLLAPGQWQVMLGIYQVKTSSASYEIQIILDNKPRLEFKPSPAPSRAEYRNKLRRDPGYRPKPQWLNGDFHVHSVYSDGKLDMDDLVLKAQKRGLQFIFSTEHNTSSANNVWGLHVPEGFLVGRGIEVTTYAGHWNAIGLLPQQLINPVIRAMGDKDTSLEKAVEEVHKSDGLAIVNHPFAECRCCSWDFSFHDQMDGIEVWNGPWKRHPHDESNEKAVEKWDSLLREGKIFPALGGSDLHEPQFEIAEPVTKVFADENSVSAIINGLRARRIYVTQHPAYEIEFQMRHGDTYAGIGDWLETAEEATVSLSLRGFPDCEMRLITEQGTIHRTSDTTLSLTVKARYVRVEVRDSMNVMLGLTNPIWLL
jgi:hypothetical protein